MTWNKTTHKIQFPAFPASWVMMDMETMNTPAVWNEMAVDLRPDLAAAVFGGNVSKAQLRFYGEDATVFLTDAGGDGRAVECDLDNINGFYLQGLLNGFSMALCRMKGPIMFNEFDEREVTQ